MTAIHQHRNQAVQLRELLANEQHHHEIVYLVHVGPLQMPSTTKSSGALLVVPHLLALLLNASAFSVAAGCCYCSCPCHGPQPWPFMNFMLRVGQAVPARSCLSQDGLRLLFFLDCFLFCFRCSSSLFCGPEASGKIGRWMWMDGLIWLVEQWRRGGNALDGRGRLVALFML